MEQKEAPQPQHRIRIEFNAVKPHTHELLLSNPGCIKPNDSVVKYEADITPSKPRSQENVKQGAVTLVLCVMEGQAVVERSRPFRIRVPPKDEKSSSSARPPNALFWSQGVDLTCGCGSNNSISSSSSSCSSSRNNVCQCAPVLVPSTTLVFHYAAPLPRGRVVYLCNAAGRSPPQPLVFSHFQSKCQRKRSAPGAGGKSTKRPRSADCGPAAAASADTVSMTPVSPNSATSDARADGLESGPVGHQDMSIDPIAEDTDDNSGLMEGAEAEADSVDSSHAERFAETALLADTDHYPFSQGTQLSPMIPLSSTRGNLLSANDFASSSMPSPTVTRSEYAPGISMASAPGISSPALPQLPASMELTGAHALDSLTAPGSLTTPPSKNAYVLGTHLAPGSLQEPGAGAMPASGPGGALGPAPGFIPEPGAGGMHGLVSGGIHGSGHGGTHTPALFNLNPLDPNQLLPGQIQLQVQDTLEWKIALSDISQSNIVPHFERFTVRANIPVPISSLQFTATIRALWLQYVAGAEVRYDPRAFFIEFKHFLPLRAMEDLIAQLTRLGFGLRFLSQLALSCNFGDRLFEFVYKIQPPNPHGQCMVFEAHPPPRGDDEDKEDDDHKDLHWPLSVYLPHQHTRSQAKAVVQRAERRAAHLNNSNGTSNRCRAQLASVTGVTLSDTAIQQLQLALANQYHSGAIITPSGDTSLRMLCAAVLESNANRADRRELLQELQTAFNLLPTADDVPVRMVRWTDGDGALLAAEPQSMLKTLLLGSHHRVGAASSVRRLFAPWHFERKVISAVMAFCQARQAVINASEHVNPTFEALKRGGVNELHLNYPLMPAEFITALTLILKTGTLRPLDLLRVHTPRLQAGGGPSRSCPWQALAEALVAHRLRRLSLSCQSFSDAHADGWTTLLKSASLHQLELDTCSFSDKCWTAVAQTLKQNSVLTELTFSACALADAAVGALLNALQGHASLQLLDLSFNAVGQGNLAGLLTVITTCPKLRHVSLYACALTATGCARIQAVALTHAPAVTVNIRCNSVPESPLEHVTARLGALQLDEKADETTTTPAGAKPTPTTTVLVIPSPSPKQQKDNTPGTPATTPARPAPSTPVSPTSPSNAADTFDYVNEVSIPDSLRCAVCSEPFVSPVATPCSHTFCKHCIVEALRARAVCPICRTALSADQLTPESPLVLKLVNELAVNCPNRPTGCSWQSHRSDVATHVRRCGFHPCTYRRAGCGWIGAYSDLVEHVESDCTCVQCTNVAQGCAASGRLAAVKQHEQKCAFANKEVEKEDESLEEEGTEGLLKKDKENDEGLKRSPASKDGTEKPARVDEGPAFAVPRKSFERVLRGLAHQRRPNVRFQAAALAAVHEATERHVVHLLEAAYACAAAAKRITIKSTDIQMALGQLSAPPVRPSTGRGDKPDEKESATVSASLLLAANVRDNAVKRLADRAGVKRMAQSVHDDVRAALVAFLDRTLAAALGRMERAQRKMLTLPDIEQASAATPPLRSPAPVSQ